MVDDPAMAKKVPDIILRASVNKQGRQVDAAQYRYEEYRFVFAEEAFAFGFIPHSYFCCNGQDYELGENRLAKVCNARMKRRQKRKPPWSRSQGGTATAPCSERSLRTMETRLGL